jgi:hypothetical protein
MVHFILISLVNYRNKDAEEPIKSMIILSPHVDFHLFLMNKIGYCQSDRKFHRTRRSQKIVVLTRKPVVQ